MDTLLDRFCRYVKVDTTAVDETDKVPSSEGQLVLGRQLVKELKKLGLKNANQNKYGIVTATIPGNAPGAPTVAYLAHMDTSPEAAGKGVKPVVHKNYNGKDIVLPGDKKKVIRVKETEGLAALKGKTIITSDGKTLLGADDKAGVAIIMTAAEKLLADKSIKHGPVRVVFTCDEEVGRGTDKIELKMIGADVAYTLDGGPAGSIENETFSADMATVTITGHNIHPGYATGKMVNAVRLAGQFLSRMPWQTLAPETTAHKQGFLHPFQIEGGVGEAKIKVLLRSFKTPELKKWARILNQIGKTIEAEHPKAKVGVEVKKQYRNMGDHLKKEPRAAALADKAVKKVGLKPIYHPIRGGTDGSRLSEMGLPTPNLFTGMRNIHSYLEWTCLEDMEQAVETVVELSRLWGMEKKKARR